MTTPLTLPVEILDHIIHYLESPPDLLHTALACRTFYKIIIPTCRLHFASIGDGLSDTTSSNSAFWKTLSTLPRFCSMVKSLTLSSVPNSSRHVTFEVKESFVSKWTKSIARHPSKSCSTLASSKLQYLLRCSENFNECRSIHIYDFYLDLNRIHHLVPRILANLSHSLDTIVIHFVASIWRQGEDPRYDVLPRCSFYRLTTFSLRFFFHPTSKELINSILDSLVYGCSTLVHLKLDLVISRSMADWEDSFCYPPLIERSNWPSLKTLDLLGDTQFFRSVKETIDFMVRHSQLERLRLAELNNKVEEIFRSPLPYHALPHLLACDFDFPVPLGILPRLYHISKFEIYDSKMFLLARSLRSCTINIRQSSTSKTILEDIAKVAPQLERLCLRINIYRSPYSHHHRRIDQHIGSLSALANLTHFGLFMNPLNNSSTLSLVQNLVYNLRVPRLSHVYCFDKGITREYQVIKNLNEVGTGVRFDFVQQSNKHLDPDLEWDFL